jgi:hypothetical protein
MSNCKLSVTSIINWCGMNTGDGAEEKNGNIVKGMHDNTQSEAHAEIDDGRKNKVLTLKQSFLQIYEQNSPSSSSSSAITNDLVYNDK